MGLRGLPVSDGEDGPRFRRSGPIRPEVLTRRSAASLSLCWRARIVGDLLHSFGEGVDVAVGDDEAFAAVGEEVFGTGGGGGEDRASAGHGLALNECEALFDAGQDEEVAGAHFFCEFGLGE